MGDNKKSELARQALRTKLDALNEKYCRPELVIGTCKKEFKMVRKIGQGSYGVVHKVQCTKSKNTFVLKVMGDPKQSTSKHLETLYRECLIHMQLDHPNIVRLYRVFYEEGQVYLIMEYADSGDLQATIQRVKDGTRMADKVWLRYA